MRTAIGVGPVRVGMVVAASALVVAACGSSGTHSGAARSVSVQPAAKHATTTTQPTAIGLRVNADERAEQVPDKPLTAAEQKALDAQLAVARRTAMQYPTVAAIAKAGFVLAGEFTPGAGAHYVSIRAASAVYGRDQRVDPANPLAYIYEGTAPTSKIVGLMYASFATMPPAGFAGPNDHWHRHTNLCITFEKGAIGIPYPPDGNVTVAQCKALHGMFLRRTFWMVHAWVVPGWKSPQGVFSHANLNLHCADGTDHTDKTGFCVGAAD